MQTSEADELTLRLTAAVAMARAAGDETCRWFRQASLAVERKRDGSPVTAADKAAEALMRERISAAFPDDAILGEELGETPGTSSYRWVLDPIDGTKSFIAGVPLYTTLVAVMQGDQAALGVIYAPITGEIVYALANQPAYHAVGAEKPRAAQVSRIERLADATFLTTDAKSFQRPGRDSLREVYSQLESTCRVTRTWGDAYGYLLVATGRADVMIDPVMNLWDAAAIQPIMEGAGGSFTDWRGKPTVLTGNGVASNALLAGAVLSITREA